MTMSTLIYFVKFSLLYVIFHVQVVLATGTSLNFSTVSECNCRELDIVCKPTQTIAIIRAEHLFKANCSANTQCQYNFENCKRTTPHKCCIHEVGLDCLVPYDDSEMKTLRERCSNRTRCSFQQIVKRKLTCSRSASHFPESVASVVQYECAQSDQKVDEPGSTWFIYVLGASLCGLIICCVLSVLVIRKRKKAKMYKGPADSDRSTSRPTLYDDGYCYASTSVVGLRHSAPQDKDDEEYNTLSHNGRGLIPKAAESSYDHIGCGSGDESYDHLKQNWEGRKVEVDSSEYSIAISLPTGIQG